MIRRACLTAVLALNVSSAFGSPALDHLYAFGDSYSDNGAGEAFTAQLAAKKASEAQQLPGSLYWQGRWTNGPTAVELLAKGLNVPLTDYAIGGAKSGNGNYYTWMEPFRDTGLLGQIADHLKAAPAHKVDPNALYFVFISANDFFEWADFSRPGSVAALGESSVTNIKKATQMLIAAGAKRLMVVGTTDLSHVPAVVLGNQVASATEFQQVLEQKLPTILKGLAESSGVTITYFDHLAFSNKLRSEAEAFGLTELDKPCQATYPDVKPVCENQDAHYYWDEWHPTRTVHFEMAKAMLAALKAGD
ncbi:SGNH/GDSL hydrolase family protein [Pseudomonas syringae pv. actinidiae]|nr:SGNH/GDSL hydrolase family protein [Pseudomonas syringae pv. actinidiae]